MDAKFSEVQSVAISTEDLEKRLLGKQAEWLMECYLKQSHRYELLASQVQIQGDNSTLGELDFLIFDRETHTPIHLEMACKFYLLDTTSETTQLWIGPNRRDSLPKKYQKWRTRQFPILYHEATKKALRPLISYPVEAFQQQCYLRAFLFVPEGYDVSVLSNSERNCLAGTYRGKEALEMLNATAQYALPQKKKWLVPPSIYDVWMSHTEARAKISEAIQQQRAVLVYEKKGDFINQFFMVWWR
ncbi:MAG: hypothetical protein CMC35_08325 [Flavobacteriaceae bacterium]|nr:hypothetical protein [Flavobacteriaceae bacterium]|tara:strand:+ start:2668 stop:3399 length:732 start_codon:yes stop_codon:yes gene_type:complete